MIEGCRILARCSGMDTGVDRVGRRQGRRRPGGWRCRPPISRFQPGLFVNVPSSPFPRRLAGVIRHPRVGTASRSLAAILGGYALAATTSSFLALALPMDRAQAVLTGMLVAIVACACAALWAFAVRTAWRAWLGIGLPAVMMGVASGWLGAPA